MTNATTHRTTFRKKVIRGSIVSALCAAALTGLATAPAQAAPKTWKVLGTARFTKAEAQKDIPTTEAQCRREDGTVLESSVQGYITFGDKNPPGVAIAVTTCQAKRDT